MDTEQAPRGAGRVGGVCTFTFDDGPDPIWTPRVLAELDRCGVQATFFVVGERVVDDPGPARAALAAGHDVELHCHRHVRHTELSEAELEADTTAALAEFERAGLGRPRYWRTPWGVRTHATERVAARHGLRLVDWTIDTHDWRGDSSAAMLEKVGAMLENEASFQDDAPYAGGTSFQDGPSPEDETSLRDHAIGAAGAIVLMHDALGPGALRAGAGETVGLIAPLAALARGRGLRLAALSRAGAAGATESDTPEASGMAAKSIEGLAPEEALA